MPEFGNFKILFVAGFGPIVRDADASQKLYRETFRIPFKEAEGGYFFTGDLDGVKHFALWPLSQAAQSCFGKESWPDELPIPQAWVEFDVDSVEQATAELESRGYRMLLAAKKEPWGQTVTRFLGPEGLLIGITFTPWMREGK
jgi:catechol 2,3-dioxygenase-like lactoylglutathione lyase family enzyme